MVVVELHAQQGRVLAGDDGAQHGVEGGVAAGVAEDEGVHHLDRRRTMAQHLRRRAQRLEQVVELERDQRLHRRQRHQPDRRLGHEAERALRAHHQPRQVDRRRRIDEGVEVVAADPAQDLGEAAIDLGGVGLRQRRDVTEGPRHDRLAPRGLGQRLAGQRRERRRRSVGQHHLLRADVIDGLAVEHRAGAARVVGHHAADGGAARRAHVRREAQAVRLELVVQFVEDDPRLDPRGPRVGIDRQDAVEVLRGVEHQPGADRLPGLRRAAAARGDRHAVPGGDGDGGGDVVAGPRQHHAARLDLVDAGVGGVEGARGLVEPHLAGDCRAQLSF